MESDENKKHWLIRSEGEILGPFTTEDVNNALKEGKISPYSLACRPLNEVWIHLSYYNEFLELTKTSTTATLINTSTKQMVEAPSSHAPDQSSRDFKTPEKQKALADKNLVEEEQVKLPSGTSPVSAVQETPPDPLQKSSEKKDFSSSFFNLKTSFLMGGGILLICLIFVVFSKNNLFPTLATHFLTEEPAWPEEPPPSLQKSVNFRSGFYAEALAELTPHQASLSGDLLLQFKLLRLQLLDKPNEGTQLLSLIEKLEKEQRGTIFSDKKPLISALINSKEKNYESAKTKLTSLLNHSSQDIVFISLANLVALLAHEGQCRQAKDLISQTHILSLTPKGRIALSPSFENTNIPGVNSTLNWIKWTLGSCYLKHFASNKADNETGKSLLEADRPDHDWGAYQQERLLSLAYAMIPDTKPSALKNKETLTGENPAVQNNPGSGEPAPDSLRKNTLPASLSSLLETLLNTDPQFTDHHYFSIFIDKDIYSWNLILGFCRSIQARFSEHVLPNLLNAYCLIKAGSASHSSPPGRFGTVHYNQEEVRLIETHIEKALNVKPQHPLVLAVQSYFLSLSAVPGYEQNLEKALSILSQHSINTNTPPLFFIIKARLCMQKGLWPCAIENWKKVLQFQPNSLSALSGILFSQFFLDKTDPQFQVYFSQLGAQKALTAP